MTDFERLLDEELILLWRMNVPCAKEILTKRYYEARDLHARRASPGLYYQISSWDLNQRYFVTFLSCLENYTFGNARFQKYLETALGHDIAHYVKNRQECDFSLLSLDGFVHEDESELTLHDVVPAGQSSDPRLFIDYFDEAMALGRAPRLIDKEVLRVASLRIEGCTFAEISARLKITPKKARVRYEKYEKEVRKIIARGKLSASS
jgi:hypothetical protein